MHRGNRGMTQPGGAVQAGQALGELTIAAVAPGGQRDCADGGGVLSFAQEAMWRSARSYANDPAHHVCAAVHLEGTVTAAALERAVEWLCARHEVLRTVFAPDGDTACQRVMPASAVTLECVDLATFAPVDRGEEVDAWIRHEALSPFDLEHGPLMRLRLLDRDASSHVLIVAAHHLVSDRRSAQLLLCELGVLYDHALTQCGLAEAPDAVPPLALQYWDYASSQRVTVPDDRLVRDLDFWRAHLASIGPLNLPLDRARPAVPSHEVGYVAIRLPPALLQGLAALVRAEGATLFMGLLAGFQALLGRYSGQEDLVVGTPV
ncbi:MAG: condensation domain-containing protein, partial [Gemmatimonadaceae bacterium]